MVRNTIVLIIGSSLALVGSTGSFLSGCKSRPLRPKLFQLVEGALSLKPKPEILNPLNPRG